MADKRDVEEYLAKIRKTIAESKEAIGQAELRLAETDRLLESQGLTREKILAWQITREQKLAVNEELRRRGLPPLEEDEAAYDFGSATDELRALQDGAVPVDSADVQGDELAERQRKFGTFMQEFRI